MERLKVKIVPASDLDNPDRLHIAFTVYSESAGALRASAGWTLKDAIGYLRLEHPHRRGGTFFPHNEWIMLLRLIEDGKPEILGKVKEWNRNSI